MTLILKACTEIVAEACAKPDRVVSTFARQEALHGTKSRIRLYTMGFWCVRLNVGCNSCMSGLMICVKSMGGACNTQECQDLR